MRAVASEFLPQSRSNAAASSSLRAPRPSLRRRSARWSWLPTKPAGWGVLIAFTVFGAAVAGTAYLAVEEIAERGLKEQMAPAALDPPAARENLAPAAPDTSVRTTATPATESAAVERMAKPESAEPTRAEVAVDAPQVAPLPENHRPRKAALENRGAKRASPRNNPSPSVAAADAQGKATSAAPDVAGIVAPQLAAAPAPEPPVPDRWETMNAALTTCARESFLAGVMCTERVRYQYCEGFWGQVPQCRAAARPGSSR